MELSLSKYFKREYSSIYRAIGGFYASREESKDREVKRQKARDDIFNFLLEKALSSKSKAHKFFLDMTGIIKKHSSKTSDRSYIYSNGNLEVGHLYSSICLGAENGWMLPASIERIQTRENKFDSSVSQITPILNKVPKESLAVCIGDSAYCCNKFIHPLSKHKHAVTITRVRSNKVIFTKYAGEQKSIGRERKYGDKHKLTKSDLPAADSVTTLEGKTSRGKIQKVKIFLYKNYISRGSKDYKMSDVPADFVCIEVFKEDGTRKYDRNLWLEVVGDKKEELSLEDIYCAYKQRFNIEHFFKFGKSKLLMDKLQTTDPKKEEDFMLFGMIAYHLLYYCKLLLNDDKLRKWDNKKRTNLNSPWRVYRAAANSNIFDMITRTMDKKLSVP